MDTFDISNKQKLLGLVLFWALIYSDQLFIAPLFVCSSAADSIIFMFLGASLVQYRHSFNITFVVFTLIFISIYRALGKILFRNTSALESKESFFFFQKHFQY